MVYKNYLYILQNYVLRLETTFVNWLRKGIVKSGNKKLKLNFIFKNVMLNIIVIISTTKN